MKKEALMLDSRDNQVVACKLCPNYCVLKSEELGKCGARKNEDGILYSLVYGGLSAMTPDPIEKKPLFHFWPGSGAYSISSVGCTLEIFTRKNKPKSILKNCYPSNKQNKFIAIRCASLLI